MVNSDLYNLKLAGSVREVDHVNKKFYERYSYPWPPAVFPSFPSSVATLFVNQDIGSWDHQRIPERPKIWVAGCGTNQALFTALKFPQATVLGTDISTNSLATCRKNADQLSVRNLYLEEKSLNSIEYENEFDYIICTGVVHHNARPEDTLKKIAGALKEDGVLEFMVYNYYHRLQSTACQNAVRQFYPYKLSIDPELELSIVKKLMKGFRPPTLMMDFISSYRHTHEAAMADTLLQPVEHSYTIESLEDLISECNLEYLAQCINQFDVHHELTSWNIKFDCPELQSIYNQLPDTKRWQISNLLLFNESPMLWFYLKRKDAKTPVKTEQEMCDDFLKAHFRKNSFSIKNYILIGDTYTSGENPVQFPVGMPGNVTAARIYKEVDATRNMGQLFNLLKIRPSFETVNDMRIRLTTSAYPYLISINS